MYYWSNSAVDPVVEVEPIVELPVFEPKYIGFSDIEVQKLKRIYDWMISEQDTSKQFQNRYNFYKYFSEHDKRRGTNFCKTFPELEEFYHFCGTIKI